MKGRGRLRVRSWGKLGSLALLFAMTCVMGVYAFAPTAGANPVELTMDFNAAEDDIRADTSVLPALSKGITADSAENTFAPAHKGVTAAAIRSTHMPKATPKPSASPKPASPTTSLRPTATPSNTAETTEAPAQAEQGTADLPYYLYFEKGSFTLTIYELDDDGAYTKVYKTYRAAHGGNKTPAGTFTISAKERWHEFPDGGFVQYATRYHARLYIHSPLYGSENAGYMWPKYYDGELGIGNISTGGCLRMVTEAARFIYEKCPEGTVFEIVNGSPKNTVSDDPPDRNGKRYDPTDVQMAG